MRTCIIIDDEPLAIKLLHSYADRITDLRVLNTFTNPLEALSFLQTHEVDVIFLDIQMPELNGMQMAKIAGEKSAIIFTTAYPSYAVEGFEIRALDYLVKPISFERFVASVSRLTTAEQSAEDKEEVTYLFVKTEYRHQKVDLHDILFLKGMGDYCAIVLPEKKIMTLENMKSFESRLPTGRFLRVHRSYIIALDKIDFIEKNRIVIGEERIPIGASYEKAFKELTGL